MKLFKLFNNLYAPWRDNYTRSNKSINGCPFCVQFRNNKDFEHYILKRFNSCAVMLNLYPYNPGHLLIIPFKHVGSLEDLSSEERAELIEVTNKALVITKKNLNCDGINIGLNLGGKAAGGSIPDHIHMHLIPRFLGDTNFLMASANTNVVCRDLEKLYKGLKVEFDKL